jgi:DMSO/TMAO reductase YedYZ molybdopterin-dependent catalytic subunit
MSEPPAVRRRPSRAAAAGAAGVGVLTAVQVLAQVASPGATFPPLVFAQWLVHRSPGSLDSFAIERLGYLTLPLMAMATGAALIAGAAGLGALAGMWGHPRAATGIPVMFALVPAPSLDGSSLLGTTLGAAVGVIAAWLVVERGERSAASEEVPRVPAVASRSRVDRRALLLALVAGVTAMSTGMLLSGRLRRQIAGPGLVLGGLRFQAASPVASPSSIGDGFDRVEDLTALVTPVSSFYVVDGALADPVIDPETWRLGVGGAVASPLRLSLEDLLAFPAVERYQTLECISNPMGGQLISTTRWTGVELRRVLEAADPRPGSVEVVFRSADGYSESLSLAAASDPTTLIAYGMDGRALSVEHGFPARILSTGTFGMKNPKWLSEIELVTSPYDGFWETRGWSKPATVKTWCRIDTPPSGRRGAGPRSIAGIAFAGDRGVSQVEVSVDDGKTWTRAELEPALSPLSWVRWRFGWIPTRTGLHTIRARAWDGNGIVQTSEFAPPHPDGASGYPVIAFTVDAV